MKLLLNDKEIIYFLIAYFTGDIKPYRFPKCDFTLTTSYAYRNLKNFRAGHFKNPVKELSKIKKGLKRYTETDIKNWRLSVDQHINKRKPPYVKFIKLHINEIISKIGEDKIFQMYKKHKKSNFIKNVGFAIDQSATFIRRKDFNDPTENCLLRNTVGNESLLLSKLDNNYPFWFIDSGYTNFIETHKKWHRLVQNHLHHYKEFIPPSDRLNIFPKYPLPWRSTGHSILIIEPGTFAANIFKIDLATWKKNLEETLRQYTDKPIVFREKTPKKQRENLYQHLLDEDYYCVININSNAANEAIWAGIPIITLDKHISNHVSRTKLQDINNLFRGNIGNYLAMLSYSQFTFEELMNGTATEIIKKYHV